MKLLKIGIVGGGIAGLTTGIALRQAGMEAEIFEKNDPKKNEGAGIIVPANAMSVYRKLGLDGEIIKAGQKIDRVVLRDSSGCILSSVPIEKIHQKTGIRSVGIARRDLHRILQNHFPKNKLHLDMELLDGRETADNVLLDFGRQSRVFDLVIGADGVHSLLAKKLNPNTALRHTGEHCLRGIVDMEFAVNEANEFWLDNGRFGIVPAGKNRTYFFATFPVSKLPMNDYAGFMQLYYGGKHQLIEEVLRKLTNKLIISGELFDRKPIDTWYTKRIVLAGDAAHPTTPNMGQGAAMAVESAWSLVKHLAKKSSINKAMDGYYNERKKRTRFITNTSWRLGKIAQLSGFPSKIRNIIFKMTPGFVEESSMKKILLFEGQH